MLNETEHLLAIVAEEAGEITQAATKSIRFGLGDIYPGKGGLNNAEHLMAEFYDLVATVEMLQERGVLPKILSYDAKLKKKEKIARWMEYAKTKGALEP